MIGSARATRPKARSAPASLTFTTANWNVAQTVTVTGVDDAVDDGDVAYTIVDGAGDEHRPDLQRRRCRRRRGDQYDNDAAGITVTPTAGLTTTEAAAARRRSRSC